ncbi:hypothetical protein ACIGXM_11600 [Kitasatospora sp. NPDC052896]|uniref:hypothetical protein n=1 Tax=Kitasatospora sp. NPDC052896 TaxID=3364061 RepID=UPI0037CBF8F4
MAITQLTAPVEPAFRRQLDDAPVRRPSQRVVLTTRTDRPEEEGDQSGAASVAERRTAPVHCRIAMQYLD